MKKYTLFIGRWNPFHAGHKYIIDSFLNNNKPVCIAVRNTDEKYPVPLRVSMIEAVYKKEIEEGKVIVMIIPDIEGVAVGRGVGYYLVDAPQNIKKISGTDIRKGLINDVPEEVKKIIEEFEGK